MSHVTITADLDADTGVIHTNFSNSDLDVLLGMCSHIVFLLWKHSNQEFSLEDICKHVYTVAQDYEEPVDSSFN